MGRLPCLGDLLRPETKTGCQKIAGKPTCFFAQSPSGKSAKLELRTRFILVPMLFSAHVGEHVERNVPVATSADARLRRPVGLTALRRTDVFASEPGPASWQHAPSPRALTPPRNTWAKT